MRTVTALRHLRPLRHVDEVARAGSLRRAAERLNLAPSALNRRVQELERELGTKLFERLGAKGMRPTAAGELLLRHIRAQAADLDLVLSQVEDLRGLRRGVVRVACSQAVQGTVARAVLEFRKAAPLVRFQVLPRDHAGALAALEAFEADLVLTLDPPPRHDLLVLAERPQRLMAVMRAEHPLAARAEVRLRDLAAHTLALPDRSLVGRRVLDAALARSSLRAEPAVECSSFETLWAVVEGEGAVAVQVEAGVPRRADLVARPVALPPIRLVLGQLRGRALPLAAARFAEALRAALP